MTHAEFPDSTPLVSTSWLAEHLDDDNLVVLDATVLMVSGFNGAPAYVSGEEEYLVNGHLPRAVFADVLEEFSDPEGEYPFQHPSAKHFEAAARGAGVDSDTVVVVYDRVVNQWAARVWWLFRAFGYEQVRVLDGGLRKWTAEGREIVTGHVPPRSAGEFYAEERTDVWVDKAFVKAVVEGEQDAVLVCGLPPKEFSGEEAPRPRAGHIPGSISAPAGRLVDPETNAYRTPEQLRGIFGDALESGAPIVSYCAGAIAATSDALALTLLGRDDVVVYDGSLNEWSADASLPIEAPALVGQA